VSWHKLSRFKKRIHGFGCYTIAAWFSLYDPERADKIMYKVLHDQFSEQERVA